jgi:hypothetical protein
MNPPRSRLSVAARQRGIILPLTAVSLFTLVGIAALAVDFGHLFLNKTRLQSAVDAAALSGAKELDLTDDILAARQAATTAFLRNMLGPGNRELRDAFWGLQTTVQFSATVNPFVPGSLDGPYIRFAVDGFDMDSAFASIFGMDELTANASAVAGPTPTMGEVCNIAPVVVCGDPNGGEVFGYQYGDAALLKAAAPGDKDIGPGNFHLIRLEDASGADDVRDAMAGVGQRCIRAGDPIPTEPGNKVGPIVDGVDARFNQCDFNGTTCTDWDIRPDMVSTPDLSHQEYEQAYASGAFTNPDPIGAPERRVIVVPFGHCTADANGQDEVAFLGFGCFFLTHPMTQKGNEAFLNGEFIQGCGSEAGIAGPVPNSGSGPYKIVLYKDTMSPDS